MKILFISDVYFPRVNGVSTSIKTFIDQLRALGHQVDLIAPDYGIKSAESHVMRIPARGIYFDPEDRLMQWGAAIKLLPELEKADYDIIHIHTPFVAHYLGLKLARQLGIPCVETYHTFFEDYLHHYCPWLPRWVAKRIARSVSKRQCNAVDALIAPSQPLLDALREYGVDTRASVIPTGLQDASFVKGDGAGFKQQYGIASNRQMLLYVGRVAHEKNIPFLLEVTRVLTTRCPNILLVVAGGGPAEPSLHQLAKTLKIEDNVMFMGYLDRETTLNSCYQSADVFVFSSKSETQGLVLLEAMAQGTPVVAIAELGTASILVEGDGALIAPDDKAVFADKVSRLIENPAERSALGKRAKRYATEHWSAVVQAEKMVHCYEQTIALYPLNKAEPLMST